MAFGQVSGLSDALEDYPGYFLKFYEQGTTIPLVMATDATGGTTLAKAEISSGGTVPIGFIKTAGDAIFIPYVNAAYDAFLIPTAAESDANDLTNAVQIADNVLAAATLEGVTGGTRRSFNTVASMVADVDLELGQLIDVDDYASSNSGVLFFKVVAAGTGTADGGKFIDLPNTTPALQAQANFHTGFRSVKQYGATGNGTTDDFAAIQAAIDSLAIFYAAGTTPPAIYWPNGSYNILSELHCDNLTAVASTSLNSIVFYGDSKYSAFIKQSATAGNLRALRIEAATINNTDVFFKMTIRGLAFASLNAAASNTSCVKIKGVDQLTLNDCQFRANNQDNDLLETEDVTNSWIYDNEFNRGRNQWTNNRTTNSRGSFNVNSYGSEYLDNTGSCMLHHDLFRCNVHDNIITPDTTTTVAAVLIPEGPEQTVYQNNVIRTLAKGFEVAANAGVEITHNIIHKAGAFGAGNIAIFLNQVKGSADPQGEFRTVVDGNTIRGDWGDGILVTNSDFYDVINNKFFDITTQNSCIRVTQTDADDVDRATITGNSCDEAGIRITPETSTGVYQVALGHPQDNFCAPGTIGRRMTAAPTGAGWTAFVGYHVENSVQVIGQPTGWTNVTEGDVATWNWVADEPLTADATTAELEAIANAINTDASKVEGFAVTNTTTGLVVIAAGNTDGAVWVFQGTGNTAHTPV